MTLIPFDLALTEDISTIFYIVSYEVLLAKKQEKEFKKLQKR